MSLSCWCWSRPRSWYVVAVAVVEVGVFWGFHCFYFLNVVSSCLKLLARLLFAADIKLKL